MRLLSKTLILPVLPALAVLALAASASAAAHLHHPLLRVPHFPASVRTVPDQRNASIGKHSNTYVSIAGTDGGACPRTAPCATISYAESQTTIAGYVHIAAGTYNQSADLTQPIHLEGPLSGQATIDGTNVDYTANGYYGVLGIDNTTGIVGTIAISNMTVTNPYITAAEASLDQSPIDIANFDSQAGDTVNVTHVALGPAQDEDDYPGIGYYSLDAQSASNVTYDNAQGMFQAFFAEGSGPETTLFGHDTVSDLVGDEYQSTFYPAIGVFALSDTSGALTVDVQHSAFTGYDGFGLFGEAGYSQGNCTQSGCTGGLTINTDYSDFQLTAAPPDSGVAGISFLVDQNDALSAEINRAHVIVASPDQGVAAQNNGGVLNITVSHSRIIVIGGRAHRAV